MNEEQKEEEKPIPAAAPEKENPVVEPEPVAASEPIATEAPLPTPNFLKRKFSSQIQSFSGLDLKKAVESLLFSSGKAMSEKDLCELTGGTPKKVKDSLVELKKDYDSRDTSLTLIQNNDVWKLNVREKYVTLVTKIVADTELPFPVLETLSVIAFKAPVMQAEVIRIRGTNAYEHISTLIEGGFVEKRKKGRSFDLGLTTKCYDYFDVQGDRSLKEALKEAKKPDKKALEKLGNLPVVDLPEPPKDENKLGALQIVDVEQTSQPRLTIDSNKPDDDFLSKIDDQISELSKRNDEHDDDEVFKRPAAEGENSEGQPEESHGKTAEIFADHSGKPTAESAYPDTDSEEEKEDEKAEKKPAEEDEKEEDSKEEK